MQYHMLNCHAAEVVGVQPALVLWHLEVWIEKNKASRKCLRDGKYWAYCSLGAMTKVFSYLTKEQIRYSVRKLKEGGYIITANYNDAGMNHTTWYSITNDGLALLNESEGDK